MTKVLYLIKGLGRGGAEQLLLNAAPHLDRERFEVHVAYLLPWKDALVGELAAAGIPATCLDGARGTGWLRRLRRLVLDGGFDVVHAHSPVAAAGARLALPRHVPIVYTEHNHWRRYHPATYWANVLTYRRNSHVFAVSDEVNRSVDYPTPLRHRPSPKVETLYHGPDVAGVLRGADADGVREEFGFPADSLIVGTVANLKPHKGYPYLLRAAAQLRHRVPQARFLLIGQGPLADEITHDIRELGLDGTVVLAGFREDVPRLAAAFDVFALGSLHEGLSIALLEAMTLGKPAVVTKVGGLPEVIRDGEEGLLVPPRDPAALADALERLLTDDVLRARMGERARERAERFDIRVAAARQQDVYAELVG